MKKVILVLLLCLFMLVDSYSQTVVQIAHSYPGTHAISSNAPGDAVPYNYNNNSVHLQFLYPASDLLNYGANGSFTIDSIGWYTMTQIGGNLTNYTIRMKNTSATSTANYDGVGLTVVRSAAPLVPATDTGWYMIPLSTKFNWNGTSNLLVDVCWGLNSSSSATGTIRHYTAGTSTERILIKNNTSNTCSSVPTQTAAFRPYLRLVGECIDKTIYRNGNVLVANQLSAVYQWIDCNTNTPIAGATNGFLIPTASGSYAVIITKGACVDTSDCYAYSMAGLNDLDSKSISLFPNPVHDELIINGIVKQEKVAVLNAIGEVLLQEIIDVNNNKIDVKNLPKGFYLLQIERTNFKFFKD